MGIQSDEASSGSAVDWSTLGKSTRASYENKSWPLIVGYCASRRLPVVPAMPETVMAFIGAAANGTLRRPGKSRLQTGERSPLAPTTLSVHLAAWRHAHVSRGLASPTADPAVRATLSRYERDRRVEGVEVRQARPVTVEDMVALCSTAGDVPIHKIVATAAILTLLALAPLPCESLARVRLADLTCEAVVTLRVDGVAHVVPCTCVASWSRWTVPPCAACLLRRMEAVLTDEEDLLFALASMRKPHPGTSGTWRDARRMAVWCDKIPRSWPALRYSDAGLDWVMGTSDELRAATAHGLGLAVTQQLSTLMFRALLLTAFRRALRFDDVTNIPRNLVARDPAMYRLRVTSSKTPEGERWLAVRPTEHDRLCAVCALDEWLWVLDAASGGAKLLFTAVGSFGPRAGAAVSYTTAWQLLARMAGDAGVAGLSMHSLRRGFAVLARQQGANLEKVSLALGHKKLETTAKYLTEEADGELPDAVAALAGLERPSTGQAPPRPATPSSRHDWATGHSARTDQ